MPDRAYRLPGEQGVILGRVFPSKRDQWKNGWELSLSEQEAARIVATAGAALVTDYWGGYVAFLCDPASNVSYVIRDCSGKIPCYTTTYRDVSVVFGEINDLDGLGLPPFEIDIHYLSAFIYWPELQVNQCAVKRVTELLAGQRLERTRGVSTISSAWDPCAIVRSGAIDSASEAQSALRSVTEYCIGAWASAHESVLLNLSGGLDSAIVLGCLARIARRPHVVCVNRFNPVPGEDERTYAKRAAELAHFDLVELPWCSTARTFEPSLLTFPRSPKPFNPLPFSLLAADSLAEVAKRNRAQAVWTGEGGDHIFFNYPTSLGAADYLQAQRSKWPGHLISVIADAARFSKEPYITVLRDSMRLAGSRTQWKSKLQASRTNGRRVSFLDYDSVPRDVDRYILHPWSLHQDDLPKGKQFQIELLLELLNRERFSPELLPAPAHHPLISQPLLELSLRIPLYVLTVGGRQRALARQAFQDVVPHEILAREDKGSTHRFWLGKIRESQPFLCDLLLNGWLASQHVIERSSLEPYLAAGRPIRPEQCNPLTASIAAEMWVRSWLNPQNKHRNALECANG